VSTNQKPEFLNPEWNQCNLMEARIVKKSMGLVPNYFLQFKIFLKPPKNVYTNKIHFYCSLISLFSKCNIAANCYIAGMDGIRQRRTIQQPIEAL